MSLYTDLADGVGALLEEFGFSAILKHRPLNTYEPVTGTRSNEAPSDIPVCGAFDTSRESRAALAGTNKVSVILVSPVEPLPQDVLVVGTRAHLINGPVRTLIPNGADAVIYQFEVQE